MGLFWKRTKSRVLTDRQELLAGRVAAAIVRRQTRVANYLNRKTQYWNRTSKLVALALFCLVFGGISLYLLLKAI
ncbi:hypothetical protein KXD93_04770 [Mucilaginibacter sp. BJC16-A38]|nr:hypothetical protein [Mucilaginibacter phenanthrenivorans]